MTSTLNNFLEDVSPVPRGMTENIARGRVSKLKRKCKNPITNRTQFRHVVVFVVTMMMLKVNFFAARARGCYLPT